MLKRFAKPFIRRVSQTIWLLATLIVLAWLVDVSFVGSGTVADYLVPAALVGLLLTWLLQRKFWRLPMPADRQTKIVIVGAGPAGLSAAYFLRQQGYREVLVLEKLGRVGGLCRTITEDYYAFDLGANYVTPAYRETLALAYEVGADLYVERPIMTVDFNVPPPAKPQFQNPWTTAKDGLSSWKFIRLCIKYMWLRYRVRRAVNPPGHKDISKHPELCVMFQAWLDSHGIGRLQRLFEAPITVMGYGKLNEIPAPYALKYMSLPTFIALALKAFPLTSAWFPWPKRFIKGFQRLWEAVAWDLNVRLNVQIHEITRNDGKIQIRFSHSEQVLNETESHCDQMEFDKLILACPLTDDVLPQFLKDLSEEERELFKKIDTESYCLTSFTTEGIEMNRPIAASLPLPGIGVPWAITKQMPDSNLFQFYSRVPEEWLKLAAAVDEDQRNAAKQQAMTLAEKENADPVRHKIVGEVRKTVERLGGKVLNDQWHTYDRWPYFQHVSAAEMRDGYYDRLEALQGKRNTYYVGAIMNFELVESCIEYSKHLVRTRFPRPSR